mmetsp:Transcript_66008/g.157829  ORF Transcript_66008/g.157829 Transcript_66008/m.157829 type:complete len:445 (-) Transcript_66008:117-1451(-)|eukprot:CAMPEP_0178443920 /NCGR_PEP_ID=MMETSP0689_2-20121128/39186_1 /TAXON_ID=160604 /ORGANISM="Amphidinium massartii, Strain CS-259" /LENGTH=444 /DNA_ID=CAMNT_0020068027 /DNA_START=49 /DNA_END=1383 /DNA_ORIENTATION=-
MLAALPGMILPGLSGISTLLAVVVAGLSTANAATANNGQQREAALAERMSCEADASLSLLQREAGLLTERSQITANLSQRATSAQLDGTLQAKGKSSSSQSPADSGKEESLAAMYEFTSEAEPTFALRKACEDCEVRRNPAGHKERQCGIVWFFHIPKCGGETVNWWLFRMKEQQELDDVYILHSMDDEIDFDKFQQEKLEPFLQAPQGKLVAVHHHDRGPGLYGLNSTLVSMKSRLQASGCDLYRMIFLREPTHLLKSTLVFFDAAEHQPGFEWVAPEPVRKLKDPTERFKVALQTDTIYDNLMVRYTLNNRCENNGPNPRCNGAKYPIDIGHVNHTALAHAWHTISAFEFVGFTEDMEAGAYKVAQDLGLRSVVVVKKHNVYGVDQANMAATTSLADLDAILDTEEMHTLVDSRTAMDKELYEAAKGLVAEREKSWTDPTAK